MPHGPTYFRLSRAGSVFEVCASRLRCPCPVLAVASAPGQHSHSALQQLGTCAAGIHHHNGAACPSALAVWSSAASSHARLLPKQLCLTGLMRDHPILPLLPQVRRNMGREVPENTNGLAALYVFDGQGMGASEAGLATAVDKWVFNSSLSIGTPVRGMHISRLIVNYPAAGHRLVEWDVESDLINRMHTFFRSLHPLDPHLIFNLHHHPIAVRLASIRFLPPPLPQVPCWWQRPGAALLLAPLHLFHSPPHAH